MELREAAQMALEALQESKPIDIDDPAAFYRSAHAIEALRVALAQPEQIECTPMPPVDDDGWCEWSYPKHKGYLMQCCDCGLVHEVEFCVLGNLDSQEDGSENGEVMEDGYQVGLRMRRHSAQPEQGREWVGLTDEERQECLYSDPIFGMAASTFARAIEAKLREKNFDRPS